MRLPIWGLPPFASAPRRAYRREKQARVLIARALAQDTPLLMADEPAAGLDPAHQISTMEVFAELAKAGRAALVSMHDLGLAAHQCTRVLLMVEGRMGASMILDEGNHLRNGRSSIRLGQGRPGSQSRPSRSRVLARTTMRRMTAVTATFLAFPALRSR